MLDTRYPYPYLPLSGNVIDATSAKLRYADLIDLPGQINIGLYDYSTNAIATGAGSGKKFFLGYSSYHTKDKLDTFLFGLTNPRGRNYWGFKGSDVMAFEYSDPITTIQSDKWALGFSGSDGCNLQLPKFECDKSYGIRVTFKGNAALSKLGHQQSFDIYSDAICCDDVLCDTGCADGRIDCERVLKQIAERTNEDQISKLFNFKARYVTNDYTAPAVSALTKYSVSVMDDGSNVALALVQQKVAKPAIVTRTARVGFYSTYEVCSVTAPAALTSEPVYALVDECGVCPVGSTTIPGSAVFTIVRPLSNDDDLTDDSLLSSVYSDYFTPEVETFDGTVAGVNVATDSITVTGHSFTTGKKVTYSNGGGTSIAGLVNGNDYYVIVLDANTIKLASTYANAVASTPVDLTTVGTGTTHTLAPTPSITMNSVNGGTALITVVTDGTVITAVNADTVIAGAVTGVTCQLPTPANPPAWSAIGTAYRTTKNFCITLQRTPCGGGDRLAELEEYYTVDSFPQIVPDSITKVAGIDCEDSYTMSIYSDGCMEDECLAADTATFTEPGSYGGALWMEVVPEPAEFDPAKRCGLVFTADTTQSVIEECEADLSNEFLPYGIQFEVSWIVNSYYGDGGEVCNFKNLAAKKLRNATESRQHGISVLRRFIESSVYDNFGDDYITPNLRKVLDSNLRKQVDRSTFYRLYYLRFKVERNLTNLDQKSEVVEAIIPVAMNRPDKMAKLEQAFLSPLTKFGVTLEKRVDGVQTSEGLV